MGVGLIVGSGVGDISGVGEGSGDVDGLDIGFVPLWILRFPVRVNAWA
jgi:hypothetical protein